MRETGELEQAAHAQLCGTVWPLVGATTEELLRLQAVWFNQAFQWSAEPRLHCFFQQNENGPCGVLTGIQALLVQKLLFSPPRHPVDPLTASAEQRDVAFVETIAGCLWKANGTECATVLTTTPRNTTASAAVEPAVELPSDRLFREHKFELRRATSEDDLRTIVREFLPQLYSPTGVVQFLYSMVLSRGFEALQKDLAITSDVHSLVYSDGCCEQAIVNFIIAGRACNELDSDNWPSELLPVGFMTVEEAYHPAACFITPAFPVWVAHGGGHYTVLWCRDDAVLQHGGGFLGEPPILIPDDDVVLVEPTTPAQHILPRLNAPSSPTSSTNLLDGIDEDDALAKALALSLEPPSNPALSDRTASAARLVLAGNDGGEDDTPMAMATSPSPATLASAATSLPDMPTTTSTPAPTGRPAAMDSAESQDQELARALAMSLEQIDASSETGSTSPLGPDAKRHKSSSDVSSASATAMAISSPSAAATGMDDDLAKAMALSMQESNSPATAPSSSATVGGLDDDLAKAMALSMQTHPAAASTAASGGGLDALSAAAAAVNDSTTSFEEEQFARIMAESAAAAGVAGPADSSYEEEQMKRALAASLIPDSGAAAVSQIFSFSHYNGLHPPNANGKPVRVVSIESDLSGLSALPTPDSTPAQKNNTQRKVQAVLTHRALLGGTTREGPWEYNIVCLPDGSMEGKPELKPSGKWRCRSCHLKTPPVWTAFMEEDENVCKECGAGINECGFCHWVKRDSLTLPQRRTFDRQHAPPITQLLRRRWPSATVQDQTEPLPSMWG